MMLSIDKCAVLELERGRLVRLNVVDQEGYKEIKESIGNEYIRRVKLKCNLNAGNFTYGMNAWAVGVMWYSGGIIDWKKEENHDMDGKTRKIMTLNRCLHPISSVASVAHYKLANQSQQITIRI